MFYTWKLASSQPSSSGIAVRDKFVQGLKFLAYKWLLCCPSPSSQLVLAMTNLLALTLSKEHLATRKMLFLTFNAFNVNRQPLRKVQNTLNYDRLGVWDVVMSRGPKARCMLTWEHASPPATGECSRDFLMAPWKWMCAIKVISWKIKAFVILWV